MTTDGPTVSANALREIGEAIGLEIHEERLDVLVQRIAKFFAEFEHVYEIDTGNLQPPAVTSDRKRSD